ncbi:MAG: glycosyltransferase family 4 protein [Candidatus Melainabacteria bacterium]|nr:glycosyltransferase family 4 protein [Candidatus Melainabacteria bacterium]
MKTHLAREYPDLVHIGPLQLIWQPFKQKHSIYERMLRKTYIWELEPLVHQYLSMQVDRQLKKYSDIDLIFSTGSFPYPNAFLETKIPIVVWSDATFAGLVEEHPGYRNICQENLWAGHALQQKVLDTAKLAIFSTEWAAESALKHYEVKESKVEVVPFGANLPSQLPGKSEIESIVEHRSKKECRLLFIGRDWIEKGGSFAVDTLRALQTKGLNTHLTVVGCEIPPGIEEHLKGEMTNFPILQKDKNQGSAQLQELLETSHFLLLPTQGECFGMVICEANAYGLPVLAHATGGVPSVIAQGKNGFCFAKPQSADDYAECIAKYFSDYSSYKSLCLAAFQESIQRLNWSTSMTKITTLIEKL